MAKETLPRLSEALIRGMASGPSFERGKSYYHDGAILDSVRQGMELRAECQGSQYEPYQVNVTLKGKGVGGTVCTCPYSGAGLCKHLVALLLAYVHEPQAFRVIPPLEALLAPRSQQELIAIIGEMIKRYPELMSVVELSAATQPGTPVDLETYRRQIRRVLRSDTLRAIDRELWALRDTAARLEKARDWRGAGGVYHVLLAEAVSHYGDELQEMDEEGDIAMFVNEVAEGVSRCLAERQPDSETRRLWLEALLQAELTDIALGGVDLAPSAWDALLEHASDTDWSWIEQRVRAEIPKSRDWAREALVSLLSECKERTGQAEDVGALIRELGTPEQRALLLIDEGKIDEGVRLMQQVLANKPGLVTEFADALVAARAAVAAVALVTEHAQGESGSAWCMDWLVKYYRQHGRRREALVWQQKVFLLRPSAEEFQALREVSRKLGTWDQVRADALKALEGSKRFGPLTEIALHEGDVPRALELLPRMQPWERGHYQWPVAQASEKSHPREALALYTELVEHAIRGRDRRTYQQAVQYLKRMRAAYKALDAASDWDAYLQSLRLQHRHLPALQDEMRQARL
ncbi:MAG: SWIM zinc finger family protein [Candidatus Entotheonellia bacterium]